MGARAAIYLLVSKGERHTDNQRPDVERVVSMRGLELVAEYEEKASAARLRPVFDGMVRDAHQGAFDVLVVWVWALDRFGRSMVGNLHAMLDLRLGGRAGARDVSNQFSVFSARVISCTPREAIYVLDGLLENDTLLNPREHYTDTHGYTEHLDRALGEFVQPTRMISRSFAISSPRRMPRR